MRHTDAILARLDGVKRSGANRWMARCPAHGDRSASLSIKECDDGKVLMHCFGCGTGAIEVMDALGLPAADLFEDKERAGFVLKQKADRALMSVLGELAALAHEATIVYFAAKQISAAKPLTDEEQATLLIAVERLARARQAA